jgi:predicted SAM-dependent methyltransferase
MNLPDKENWKNYKLYNFPDGSGGTAKTNKISPHMRLDIGSGNPTQGEQQPNGFVLNDIETHSNIDIVCDIKNLGYVIPDGYCSEVRASHILEHFTKDEGVGVIKMVWKLLEKGGQFTIFVPNFKWHAELMLTGNDEMAVHYAFGGQLDEYDQHKTAFSPKILKKRLEENGFTVKQMIDGTSISCVAIKVV